MGNMEMEPRAENTDPHSCMRARLAAICDGSQPRSGVEIRPKPVDRQVTNNQGVLQIYLQDEQGFGTMLTLERSPTSPEYRLIKSNLAGTEVFDIAEHDSQMTVVGYNMFFKDGSSTGSVDAIRNMELQLRALRLLAEFPVDMAAFNQPQKTAHRGLVTGSVFHCTNASIPGVCNGTYYIVHVGEYDQSTQARPLSYSRAVFNPDLNAWQRVLGAEWQAPDSTSTSLRDEPSLVIDHMPGDVINKSSKTLGGAGEVWGGALKAPKIS